MLKTDRVVGTGPLVDPADRSSAGLQRDPAAGLSVLHVVVKAGPTNSQYNEHCLPTMHQRRITVCSLFAAEVAPPDGITLVQGDGSVLGCFRALRVALTSGSYDVVHVHAAASGVLTLATYASLRRPRRDLVFTFHTSWPNLRLRNRLFMHLIVALFPVVVACSEASAQSLPPLVRRLAGRLEVVANGVDVGRIDRVLAGEARPPEPRPGEAKCVVSVGRLIKVKDPGVVLSAFRRQAQPADRLVMVGDGELLPALAQEDASTTSGARVIFTGVVPREEVYRIVQRADVFVSASRVEGMPVAVLEAMASRCPVVLSDIAPHREIATRAPSVALVDPGDAAGFAEAIRRATTMSPGTRQRLGEELRRCATGTYSVERMNESYGRIYRRVAARDDLHRPGRVRGLAHRPVARRVAYVASCSLLGAAAAFGYGRLHPQMYDADVTLTVGDGSTVLTDDALTDGAGSAADLAGLVATQPVLQPVAERLGVPDWRSLRAQVHGSTASDDPASLVVTASASAPGAAERLAAAVSHQLLVLTPRPAAAAFDAGFADRELDHITQEIERTNARLDSVLAGAPSPDQVSARRQREMTDLRSSLGELNTDYEGLLDRRSLGPDAHGLTIAARTAGRAAPPLPRPGVLALAGGAAGACLALAFWLLVRQDERTRR